MLRVIAHHKKRAEITEKQALQLRGSQRMSTSYTVAEGQSPAVLHIIAFSARFVCKTWQSGNVLNDQTTIIIHQRSDQAG